MATEIGKQIALLLESCIARKSLRSGQLLHTRIFRSGLLDDTFLFNRLIEFYSKCNHLISARNVFDNMPSRDMYSWNAILGATCSGSKLADSYDLFDEMPERNVVSWNNMITALVKGGYALQSLELYMKMIGDGLVPTHFTLASVLSACGIESNARFGKRCHGTSIKVGIDNNMYVGNALLGMYAKCSKVNDAVKVFRELREPNEVSFTAVMSGLAKTEDVRDALEMFRLMHKNRVCIDAVSLSTVLGLCTKGASGELSLSCKLQGQLVHNLAFKLGFESDFHLRNSLLDMYSKTGDLENAEIIFQYLPKRSNISWNIMIAGYGQNNQIGKAIELMQRMECSGFEPDEVTYINMLVGCVKSENVVIAHEIFDRMESPSLSSWNAMLSGYSLTENHRHGVTLFRQMQFKFISPDRTTLAIILRSCTDMGILESGREVHAVAQKALFHTDMYVGSGLITLYSKCRKMDLARCIFERLPELDIVCWNSMITGYACNSVETEAFIFFNMMRKREVPPSEFSYASLLSCCAELSNSLVGRQMHAQVLKDGYINDVFVGSCLIGMYSKCGDVDKAREVFERMACKSRVTWNEMIHGYAQNGRGEEAVSLYGCMTQSGESDVDEITFMCVLTACSHAGLVDEGVNILESIQVKHKIIMDHYTCVIDGLGRAGRLHEAEMLVNKIACKDDDPVMWEVLLSCCRFHEDVPVAKRAAERLFDLNPGSHTPYVLLANTYSCMGRWEEAKAVRELMSRKCLVKHPGFSLA